MDRVVLMSKWRSLFLTQASQAFTSPTPRSPSLLPTNVPLLLPLPNSRCRGGGGGGLATHLRYTTMDGICFLAFTTELNFIWMAVETITKTFPLLSAHAVFLPVCLYLSACLPVSVYMSGSVCLCLSVCHDSGQDL